MKKHVFGRQLSRDTNERKALFKGLINSLVMLESVKTTEAKAKAIRGQVEKLITKAKRKQSLDLLKPWLQKDALEKMVEDLAGRFANRPGGYTRIISLNERFGDNAKMAIIEFVEKAAAKETGPEAHQPLAEKGIKRIEEPKTEKVKTKVARNTKKRTVVKKEKSIVKKQRPPSRSEMEKRKAGE